MFFIIVDDREETFYNIENHSWNKLAFHATHFKSIIEARGVLNKLNIDHAMLISTEHDLSEIDLDAIIYRLETIFV